MICAMYETEREEFNRLIRDLCMAVNRPCNDDLLRVMWEDLKAVPFAQLDRQAKILRVAGKKGFTSNDLRPPPDMQMMLTFNNHEIVDRIDAFVLRHIWASLTVWQRLCGREWVYTRDKIAPRCIGLRIKPDKTWINLPDENGTVVQVEHHHPGRFIRLEDCDLDYTPPHIDARPQLTDQAFDEAQAARDLLNRKA